MWREVIKCKSLCTSSIIGSGNVKNWMGNRDCN